MTSDSHTFQSLVQAVADGQEIDWKDVTVEDATGPMITNLGKIQAVCAAFSAGPLVRLPSRKIDDRLFGWGHLDVLALIGEGSYGEVYRAYDPILDREIALKIYKKEKARLANFRYVEEARLLARVRHPHVLAVHGADIHDGRPGIWSDLITGETLEHKANRVGCMHPNEVCYIAVALSSALDSVHGSGLLHGDVKASNIMEDQNGNILLMDFGSGSFLMGANVQNLSLTGTPLYMAPEMLAGHGQSVASDMYALGVLLFRLLTQDYPAHGSDLREILKCHTDGKALNSMKQLHSYPKDLRLFISSLLSFEPEKRPTAHEALERVQWILNAPKRRKKNLIRTSLAFFLLLATFLSTTGFILAKRAERKAITEADRAFRTRRFMGEIMSAPRPFGKGGDVKVLDVIKDALDRLALTPDLEDEVRQGVLLDIGWTFRALEQFDQAETCFKQSYDLAQRIWGQRSLKALEPLCALGINFYRAGRLDEAEVLLAQVLEALKKNNQEGVIELKALALARLGSVLLAKEKFNESEAILNDVLSIESQIKPGFRNYIYLARESVGDLAIARGQFSGAVTILQPVLEWYESNYGPMHNFTYSPRSSLATALVRSGKLEEAEEKLRRNIELIHAKNGDQSLEALLPLCNLAAVLEERGQYSEAATLTMRAVDLAREVRGEEHKDTLQIMGNLAVIYQDQGDITKSLELQRYVLKIKTRTMGPTDLDTLLTAHNAAELEVCLGNFALAFEQESKVRTGFSEKLGEDHLFTLEAREILALSLIGLGHIEKGERDLREVIACKRKVQGIDHPYTLNGLMRLAQFLIGQGRFDEARTCLSECLEARRRVLGKDHPKTMETETAWADLNKEM